MQGSTAIYRGENGENPDRGWLRRLLGRHTSEIVYGSIDPHEDPRLSIPREFFMCYFELVRTHVDVVNPELGFNLDETGNNDWPERKGFSACVPAGYRRSICTFRSTIPSNIKVCSFA
jgi:hypothetical protein